MWRMSLIEQQMVLLFTITLTAKIKQSASKTEKRKGLLFSKTDLDWVPLLQIWSVLRYL